MRIFHALLVLLLALSPLVPHHARAAAPTAPVAAMHHDGHHGAGDEAPAHDSGKCTAGCIGCAFPDAPLAIAMPRAALAPSAPIGVVPVARVDHAFVLDPPPPRTA